MRSEPKIAVSEMLRMNDIRFKNLEQAGGPAFRWQTAQLPSPTKKPPHEL